MELEESFNLAPKCKSETIWRLAQKWMDEPDSHKPTTPEAFKVLLDRLTDYMGGMIKQSFYLMTTWDTTFPEPEGYEAWDMGDEVSDDVEDAIHRLRGQQEALEYIRQRHGEVYNDFALMICGR